MNDVLKMGKKMFTVSVVVLTIMWSMGIAAFLPAVVLAADCPVLEAGDLFKVPDNTAVYLLNADMERMYFPNSEVYHTWYEDFSGVQTIPNTCVDAYPAPSKAPYGVNYRAGSRLVKVQISPTVYVVEPNNTKSKLASETVAKDLYGSNWAKVVRDVADVYWPNYAATGAEVIASVPHNGMLVKKTGETAVYTVSGGKLYAVDGTLGKTAKNDVRTVSATVFGALELATGTKTAAAVVENAAQTIAGATPVTPVTPVTGGDLTVSLAADTPAAAYAIKSAARVAFTKVVFKAGAKDVTIDSFKVKRTGAPAVDSDFSTINVVDPNGNLLNDSGKTLNSDHEVSFTENQIIPAGTSKTYTLVGNMAAFTNAGNVPKLSITSVTLVGTGAVTGLPVEGNAMTTNASLTLGTVTLATGGVIGTVTKQVGINNVNLANLKITNTGSVDTKPVKIEKIVFYNSESMADSDITNYKLKYNSNAIATGVMSSKYLTFDLSACTDDCTLAKGYDRTYEVYGDLTAGSGRKINLDVQYATHVLVKDVNNSVYLTPTDNATALDNTITIAQGKLNVTKDNVVQAGNIAGNATNVTLAAWNFNVVGEPIDIRTLVFKIVNIGTVKASGLDSLVLYDKDGKALIGGQDGVGDTTTGYATSTDTFTLQPGDNILTLKGTVDNTAVAADTITISVDMANTSNFIAKGVNSGLDITLGTYATPNALVAANIKTVATSALSITTLATPAAQSFAAGTSGVLFAKVMLDASASSEDIKVSQFKATVSTTLSHTMDIQNIKLWVDKDGDSYNGAGATVALTEVEGGDSASAGTGALTADETLTWNLSGDDQFLIKAGKKLVVEIKGNIAGGATAGTVQIQTNTAITEVTATGQTTKTSVTPTITTSVNGPIMTIGAAGGQVEVSLSSDNPNAKLLAAGSTVTLAAYKFLATTTEDIQMDYMYLTQVVAVTASSSYKDYDEIWFEDAAGLEIAGTRTSPTSTKPLVDFTDGAFVVKTTDNGKILFLRAKLAAIGTGSNGVSGHQLGYKVNAAADIVAKGNLSGSGATEFLGGTVPTGNTHYVYKAYPVFARQTVATTKLVNGTRDLFKFQVSAVNGDIGLYGFTFDVATTTAIVTAGTLYVYDATDTSEVQVNNTAGTVTYYGTGVVWQTVGTEWTDSYSGSEMTVSVSKPRTYIVRGNITGATTGAAVSVGMAGDSAGITGQTTLLMLTANNVNGLTNNDFIWSDKNNDSHANTTADWVNGHLVSGLSSTTSTLETVAY